MNNKYKKYPRTLHLPFSESKTNDDKSLTDTSNFNNKEVVVTIKMDGENTTLYNDYLHARSIDSKNHISREWIKRKHAEISFLIPEKYRICGENLFAKHSIHYTNLEGYFYVFSVWNEDLCLSWLDTTKIAHLLELPVVPVIYHGIYDEKKIQELYKEYSKKEETEGFVVRLASSFHYDNFSQSVAKYVRKNHVQTDEHWMHSKITPNKLKSK